MPSNDELEPRNRPRARSTPPPDLRGADLAHWVSRNGTPWERCLADILSAASWGLAGHSRHRADPPLHIVVSDGGQWRTWCGYGRAREHTRNVTGRRCGRCMTLARQQADEFYEDYIDS